MESTIFDNSAASWLIAMMSGSASGPSVLPVPKSAGIVEGAGSSSKEIMLDEQLTKAFQTGLRHSLDDPDHDAMSDLSRKMSVDYTCQSMVAAGLDSFAATVHFSLPFSAYLLVHTVAATLLLRGCKAFKTFIVDRYSLVDVFFQVFLHRRDWEAASRGLRAGWSEEWEYGGVFYFFQLVLVRN